MASLLLLHTCESEGTAEANAEYLVRIGAAPHWVFDPRFGVDEAIHLVPYTQAGKALRNLPGGVETNRRERDNAEGVDIIQVELVGYAAHVAGYDDAWYAHLRTFLLEICAATGVPYVFPRRFAVRYGDDSVRYTPGEWNDPELVGIVGHCHAPENDHWDPGQLDLARLTAPTATPTEDDEMLGLIHHPNPRPGRSDVVDFTWLPENGRTFGSRVCSSTVFVRSSTGASEAQVWFDGQVRTLALPTDGRPVEVPVAAPGLCSIVAAGVIAECREFWA